jgi:hypothetical protein
MRKRSRVRYFRRSNIEKAIAVTEVWCASRSSYSALVFVEASGSDSVVGKLYKIVFSA